MAAKVGRAPKEFTVDYECNVAAEFELWLEDVNDCMAICKSRRAKRKEESLFELSRA